ncbi:uroporphyrinogen-III synthase [Panacibacter ginsenosidivorans]|nr:uroporphyrinogen-III synthase [Panacibacter ginsenosidivorans]
MLIYKAANKGISIDEVSFVETEAIITTDIIEKIKNIATKKATVVFTSMNAVDAVTAQLTQIPDWKIFCVGGVTKETVFNFFGEKSVEGTAKNAKMLAEKIILTGESKEVFFFCGDQRLDELPETLNANDIKVNEVIVYTTRLIPNFIVKNYDGIIFFSPSAVHSFFSDNTIATSVVLFSIGTTTTATIKTYCTNKIITSEWPGKENMIDLVLDYYKT